MTKEERLQQYADEFMKDLEEIMKQNSTVIKHLYDAHVAELKRIAAEYE